MAKYRTMYSELATGCYLIAYVPTRSRPMMPTCLLPATTYRAWKQQGHCGTVAFSSWEHSFSIKLRSYTDPYLAIGTNPLVICRRAFHPQKLPASRNTKLTASGHD